MFFIFTPNLGEDDPIWRAYFSKGLVQPPTSYEPRMESWDDPPSITNSYKASSGDLTAELGAPSPLAKARGK